MQENNSQNANLIIARLKKMLKIATDIELSKILNVKPNTISSWKKRDTLDYNSIISICELYEIDLNEVFLNTKSKKNVLDYSSCKTPLVSSELQFQYCVDKESLVENLPLYHFPFIKSDNSILFQVSSNNMHPIIESNSFIVCELTSPKNIKNNSLTVIISRTKGFFINRILINKENNAVFTLSNENSFFSNIEFKKSDINEIWLIKGVLSYDLTKESHMKLPSGISIIKPNETTSSF